jgi:hypothetical protein
MRLDARRTDDAEAWHMQGATKYSISGELQS